MEFLLKSTDCKSLQQHLAIYVLIIAAEHLIVKALYQLPNKWGTNPPRIADTLTHQYSRTKAALKKRQKITPKPIRKHSDVEFIDKDSENESDALSISSTRSGIPSLLSPKKRNHKREQPTRGIHGQTAANCGKLPGTAAMIQSSSLRTIPTTQSTARTIAILPRAKLLCIPNQLRLYTIIELYTRKSFPQ